MDNETYLEQHADEIISIVLARLDVLGRVDLRGKTAEDLLRLGVVDPIKIFIKNEPHKAKKWVDFMFRLISNISLGNQLEDRLIYAMQNMLEIDEYITHPSKPGMGLHDEGMTVIHEAVNAAGCRISEIDVESWDWSFNGSEYYFDALLRIRLYDLDENDWLSRVILNRHYCVSMGVMLDSGGVLYAQTLSGIMKSGWYNTGSSNSHVSCDMARKSGSSWCICMGDDVLKSLTPGTKEFYERWGHRVKMCKEADPNKFEFCSTIFENGVGYPADMDKTTMRLLSNKTSDLAEKEGLFEQYCFNIRHHPERDAIEEAARKAFFL